jgi:hypothetical protein
VPPASQREVPAGPQARDGKVVAFLNGEPITWGQVTERAMNLGGRDLIDQYIYARLRDDIVRRNGIANTPDDLRARAQAIVDNAKRAQGEERVKALLRQEGVTEAQYVQRFVDDPLFAERLLTEKAYLFTLFCEATIEVEFVGFTDEKDAEKFLAELAGGAPFAKAAESTQPSSTASRILRFPRRRLARGFLPAQIAHLEDRLFRMKDGERTDLERTSQNLALVARVAKVHPPDGRPYASQRESIVEEILRSPPNDEQVKQWMDRLFRGSKIHYEDRYSARDQK